MLKLGPKVDELGDMNCDCDPSPVCEFSANRIIASLDQFEQGWCMLGTV